ncbi:MAG: helix-turn-helix domain-containing protein [Bacilli bacterium]
MDSLATRFNRLRKQHRQTQERATRELGSLQPTIGNEEKGRHMFRWNELAKIVNTLGVTLDFLLLGLTQEEDDDTTRTCRERMMALERLYAACKGLHSDEGRMRLFATMGLRKSDAVLVEAEQAVRRAMTVMARLDEMETPRMIEKNEVAN